MAHLGGSLGSLRFFVGFYLKIANIALETSTNLSLNVYGPRSTCQYRTPIYQHSVSNKPSFLVICLDKTRAIKSVVEISGVLKQGKVEIGTIKTTFELQLQGGLINEYITSTHSTICPSNHTLSHSLPAIACVTCPLPCICPVLSARCTTSGAPPLASHPHAPPRRYRGHRSTPRVGYGI